MCMCTSDSVTIFEAVGKKERQVVPVSYFVFSDRPGPFCGFFSDRWSLLHVFDYFFVFVGIMLWVFGLWFCKIITLKFVFTPFSLCTVLFTCQKIHILTNLICKIGTLLVIQKFTNRCETLKNEILGQSHGHKNLVRVDLCIHTLYLNMHTYSNTYIHETGGKKPYGWSQNWKWRKWSLKKVSE